MAELSAQGPVGAGQATSIATTDAVIPVGTRMRDTAGNEYIYLALTEQLRAGQWAVLNQAAGTASRLATASRGKVGILMADASSIDNAWFMIYGVYDTAQIDQSSEATSIYVLGAPAGATTEAAAAASSLVSLATNLIFGAFPRAAASTATTLSSSAHTGVTIQVELNYPFVLGEAPTFNTTIGSS